MTYHTDTSKRQAIANGLTRFLADSFTLYGKAHICHWNITGPHFHDRHVLLEVIYNDMWLSLDIIAERIRALGAKVPVSLKDLSAKASLQEMTKDLDENAMFEMLVSDCHGLAALATEVSAIAEGANDRATADLLTARTQMLEKHAWMMNASLISQATK